MRTFKLQIRFNDLVRWAITLSCLGMLPLLHTSVQADEHVVPPYVWLYPSSITKLCVGQIATFQGWYHSDPAPLVEGQPAPPTQELSIDSTANIGNIAPKNKSVYTGSSGFYFLTYTATQEGNAVIKSSIGQFNGAPITLKVLKACKYNYKFFTEVHYSFKYQEVDMAETYRFHAEGLLKTDIPDDYSDLKDEHASLKYNGQLDSFALPSKNGVTISKESYSPAQGSATAAAHGELDIDGYALHFYMTKSKLNSDSKLMIKITSKNGTAEVPFANDLETFIFSFFNQHANQPDFHFVDVEATADGGTYSVDLPDLKQICDFLNQSPGIHCEYRDTIELEIAED